MTWRTCTRVSNAFAEIAPARSTSGFHNYKKQFPAVTETLDLNLDQRNTQGEVNYHSVIFEDLNPDTLYAYRVGDGDKRWSEWIQFRTASSEPKPFRFLYFGDAQNDVLSHWARTIRMAAAVAPDAQFAVHAGDLINQAHVDLEWAEWFKAGGFLHSQWTGVPVAGNHEYRHMKAQLAGERLALLWRPQFTLPIAENIPEELRETVYSVFYQGLQLIVLDSNKLAKEQIPYLEGELRKPSRWKVVTFHHPVFSPRGRPTKEMIIYWKDLFEKYNVDLVLQGHDHSYTRGQVPLRTADGFESSTFQTMYVTSVSGPKLYEIKHDVIDGYATNGLSMKRTGENTQFFQVISVEDNRLTYEAYTTLGELYDSVVIQKDFESGLKTITENSSNMEARTFENTSEYTFKKDEALKREKQKAAEEAK